MFLKVLSNLLSDKSKSVKAHDKKKLYIKIYNKLMKNYQEIYHLPDSLKTYKILKDLKDPIIKLIKEAFIKKLSILGLKKNGNWENNLKFDYDHVNDFLSYTIGEDKFLVKESKK